MWRNKMEQQLEVKHLNPQGIKQHVEAELYKLAV